MSTHMFLQRNKKNIYLIPALFTYSYELYNPKNFYIHI